MPLCPQITNTPITVTLTSDFTVTNVVPVLAANTQQLAVVSADATAAAAAAAAAQASATAANATAAAAVSTANSAAASAATAQSTANTALANAATAYTAAVGSLQPSASTIVNASNQMTAINGGGITVYSGLSATTGARVVLNSAGLAGFNSSSTGPGNGATFSISASTGAAVFSGSVTGATITGSDLNIAGVFLVNGATGVMTATSATVTGTINATSGYFGTLTNGWSISSTGLVGVGSGTIVGGIISGTQFTNGSTFSVSPTGYLLASDVNLTGTIQATAGYIGSATNGWIFTSSGFLRNNNSTTILYPTTAPGGDANTYSIFTDRGVYAERIYSTGTQASSIFSLGGLSVNGQVAGAAGAFVVNSSGNMTTVGSITASGTVSTSGAMSANTLSVASTTTFSGASNSFPNITTSTSAANLRWGTTTSGRIFEVVASSARFKENIVDINTVYELQANKLLDLPVRAFTYKSEYLSEGDERAEIMVPGFITEEMDEIYPIAVDYEKGVAHNWNEKFVIPGMLALIQDLYKEVQTLKGE